MYLILTKTEYSDTWDMKTYEDLAHAKAYLLEAVKKPGEIVFAQTMDFSIEVKLKESGPQLTAKEKYTKGITKAMTKEGDKSEASEGGPEEDSSAGGPGNSAV